MPSINLMLTLLCVSIAMTVVTAAKPIERPTNFYHEPPKRARNLRPDDPVAESLQHHQPIHRLRTLRDWEDIQHNLAFAFLVLNGDSCWQYDSPVPGSPVFITCGAMLREWQRVADAMPDMQFGLVNFSESLAGRQRELRVKQQMLEAHRGMSPLSPPPPPSAVANAKGQESYEDESNPSAIGRFGDEPAIPPRRRDGESDAQFAMRRQRWERDFSIFQDDELWLGRQFVSLYCRDALLPAIVLLSDRSLRAAVHSPPLATEWGPIVDRERQSLELYEGKRWKRNARKNPRPPLPDLPGEAERKQRLDGRSKSKSTVAGNTNGGSVSSSASASIPHHGGDRSASDGDL